MAHHTESQQANTNVEDHPWHALTAEAVLKNLDVHEGGLSTEHLSAAEQAKAAGIAKHCH